MCVAVSFNGNSRSGVPGAGAYALDPDGNPGWRLAESFKAGS